MICVNVSYSSIKQRQQSLLSKLICRRSTSTYVYVNLQYKDLTNESAKETFTAWTNVDTYLYAMDIDVVPLALPD